MLIIIVPFYIVILFAHNLVVIIRGTAGTTGTAGAAGTGRKIAVVSEFLCVLFLSFCCTVFYNSVHICTVIRSEEQGPLKV